MIRKNLLPLLLVLVMSGMFKMNYAGGWEKRYSPDVRMGINSVYQLPNYTFLVSGVDDTGTHQRLMNIDFNGNVLWQHDFDSITGAATNIAQNNGYVMLGNDSYLNSGHALNYSLLKVNSAGQKVWLKSIYQDSIGNPSPSLLSVDTTNNNGFICAMNVYNDTVSTVLIERTDSLGNVLWARHYYSSDTLAEYVYGIRNSKDGGFIVAIDGYQTDSPMIFKIDSAGNTLWNYNVLPVFGQSGASGTISRDGNILIVGNGIITKLNQSGSTLWRSNYGGLQGGYAWNGNIIEKNDGVLVLLGSFTLGGSLGYSFVFTEADTIGNVLLWNPINASAFGSVPQLFTPGYQSMIPTIDGGYLLGGMLTQDPNRNSGFLIKMDTAGTVFSNHISGYVYYDMNNNCVKDPGDPGLAQRIISFSKYTDSFLVAVSDSGYYSAQIDTGTYNIGITHPSVYWGTGNCGTSQVNIAVNVDTIISFAQDALVLAPYLVLDAVAPPVHSTHAPATYALSYCNTGTAPFVGTIVVTIDTMAHVSSSSPPWQTPQIGNRYVFKVDTLGVGQCASLEMFYTVNYNSTTIGRSLCINANALPDTAEIQSPAWDRSNLLVHGACNSAQDSITFTLQNTGSGNMQNSEKMVVIEDNVILSTFPIQLASNQNYTFAEPANGSTWRATIPQTPYNPYSSFTTAGVEACGDSTWHLGHINEFSINPFFGFDYTICPIVQAPYDPNHKSVLPTGAGVNHLIDSSTVLEYSIEFQNTGNAPATTVRVVDTLAAYLNPLTIKPGISSFPCTMQFLANNVVAFTFASINLPDTAVSDTASSGFVNFTISQYPGNVNGSVINNNAAIYFDYNPPIITNTATVTLGQLTIEDVQTIPGGASLMVNAYPNPFTNQTLIKVEGAAFSEMELNVYDLAGRLVSQQRVQNANQFIIDRKAISSGSYLFEISSAGQTIARGKIIAQ